MAIGRALALLLGMKVLRLVKGSQSTEKKNAPREQRFRFGTEEIWQVSCGPARKSRPAHQKETRKAS